MLPFSYYIPHSSFLFLIHEINFIFSTSIAPNTTSYQCSSLYHLKIIPPSVGHLISTLFSYRSLHLIIPLLIRIHLLLIVGLWSGLYLQVQVCFLASSIVQAAPVQQHMRYGGKSDIDSTSGKEGHMERCNNNQNPETPRKPAQKA